MKRHGVAEIERALTAIDAALDRSLRLVIIGGAAVGLHTGDATFATRDIDTWQLGAGELQRLAVAVVGVDIDIGPASVAELPWNFEDRVIRLLPQLIRLEVFVPEAHDLALSKILRWYEGDEQQLRHLHHHRALDVTILVQRFRTEINHVTGDPRRHREHLLQCVDVLFGALEAARADAVLPG